MWKIEVVVGAVNMDTSETTMYDWHALPWRKLERGVFKLQTRIYQASRRGETEAVHKLQRLLIHSRSAALLAVRRVAQENQGKRTAGIDGISSLSDRRKFKLAEEIHRRPLVSKAKPVRRVWIPKPGKDEKRPLGIPVMEDRARQALAKMALEPEWEAKFEPTSFGFRPGRSCHDAVEKIYRHMRNVPKYVLDADIAKCFDRINHEALLNKLGTFPSMRRAIKAWLKAGIMDGGELFPVSEGTPQGGVISPLLANIALHGLPETDESSFSFDTGGGTQHITQSIETVSSYAPSGKTAPDFGGAIGVTHDNVEGVDIAVPVYHFSETHYIDDSLVTPTYRGTLFGLTGKTNNASFKGCDAGECLFLGASGSKRGSGDWEITFRFAASPNKTGLTVGEITGIAKKGWEYLWVRYADAEDSTAKALVKKPVAVYVEKVYEAGSFSGLGIGT